MLKNWAFDDEGKPDKDACKARLKQLRQELAGL